MNTTTQLTCRDCGALFEFTDGEKEFYATRGLADPQRCKDCREKRKSERMQTRQMYPAVCATCSADCEVPFQPRSEAEGGRPVLCHACFKASKGNA